MQGGEPAHRRQDRPRIAAGRPRAIDIGDVEPGARRAGREPGPPPHQQGRHRRAVRARLGGAGEAALFDLGLGQGGVARRHAAVDHANPGAGGDFRSLRRRCRRRRTVCGRARQKDVVKIEHAARINGTDLLERPPRRQPARRPQGHQTQAKLRIGVVGDDHEPLGLGQSQGLRRRRQGQDLVPHHHFTVIVDVQHIAPRPHQPRDQVAPRGFGGCGHVSQSPADNIGQPSGKVRQERNARPVQHAHRKLSGGGRSAGEGDHEGEGPGNPVASARRNVKSLHAG